MNELTFRPITAADETDFYTMAEEFYHSDAVLHPIPAEYHRRAFAEMMRSGQYLSGYIFTDGDNTAGFAVTNRMMQHEAGGMMVWVEDLYIRPAYRGQGLGSRFLAWLEEQLRGDAVMLRLETEPENERAQELYYRLGYENLNYLQMIKRLDEENA
jgi:ribosomal protein S18 acetylase RimI-like enzyme